MICRARGCPALGKQCGAAFISTGCAVTWVVLHWPHKTFQDALQESQLLYLVTLQATWVTLLDSFLSVCSKAKPSYNLHHLLLSYSTQVPFAATHPFKLLPGIEAGSRQQAAGRSLSS